MRKNPINADVKIRFGNKHHADYKTFNVTRTWSGGLKMAEELRGAIAELLWTGLNSHDDHQSEE